MANEIQTARGKIKTKLDISDTSFDSIINDCIEQAIPRLKPFVQYQLPKDETLSVSSTDDSFTLPVSGSALQRLYIKSSSTDVWREVQLWRQARDIVYIKEPISSTSTLRIFASRAFVYTDADLALLAVDYPSAMLPLYYFAMSEFVSYIIGNKRKFNIYQQMSGVRTVAEMQDLSTFYENKAIRILEDEISAEGQ